MMVAWHAISPVVLLRSPEPRLELALPALAPVPHMACTSSWQHGAPLV
jgi:hypothetical protein